MRKCLYVALALAAVLCLGYPVYPMSSKQPDDTAMVAQLQAEKAATAAAQKSADAAAMALGKSTLAEQADQKEIAALKSAVTEAEGHWYLRCLRDLINLALGMIILSVAIILEPKLWAWAQAEETPWVQKGVAYILAGWAWILLKVFHAKPKAQTVPKA